MQETKRLAQVKDAIFSARTCHRLRAENGFQEIPKTCILNNECYHCAFDQWMDAMEDNEALLLAEAA